MYISLLLAVIIQSTGSIWIYLGFKINHDYITSQLCINRFETIPVCKGSCYLEEKIKEEKNNSDTQIKIKLLEVVMVLPVFDLNHKKSTQQPVQAIFVTPISSEPLSEGFCFGIFKPPVLLS
ncbi:hypothetical protein FXV77_20870 [Sphingobacterium phlebotomi]|uniref:Uncharacterized protein n=1 Tax=Sphingobacterium phlebotomi TaxID=2605433 RepID=A0A5D4GTP0_9SPHI|nr:hypothetical protein [Sphingobacterium phlebotomi]TYR31698.1 hypothetical protein FXV77_20870 [Sphingobacterium phlebotomi]